MRTLLLALWLLAQEPSPGHQATVGMRARIDEIVLPGAELIVAPGKPTDAIVLRILAVRPHGSHFRYDIEWSGLEPGEHDLARFLVRKDGTAAALPPIPVRVSSLLPKKVKEPSDLELVAPPRLGGYRSLQIGVAIAWGVGLLAILLVGRRWRKTRAAAKAAPTLADRLRPIVEDAAAGRADEAAKAELERLLLTYWRHRLGLREERAADAIVAIKHHAEAGALLRQLEAWLHMQTPPKVVDVQALLAPYRNVSAADFEKRTLPAEAR